MRKPKKSKEETDRERAIQALIRIADVLDAMEDRYKRFDEALLSMGTFALALGDFPPDVRRVLAKMMSKLKVKK